jgi:L-lactate dehydrogenase complex protein LldG
MTSKEQILNRIRLATAENKTHPVVLPPPPKVWDIQGLSTDEMIKNFQINLEAVKGELILCDHFDQALQKIDELFVAVGAKKIAVLDRSLSRKVAEQLSGKEFIFASDAPSHEESGTVFPEFLAKQDAGLVSPEYLLADTGSCLFAAPTAFDRLMTYMTPLSVVIAETSMLRENLPAVWPEMKPQLEKTTTGEFVIVTGPSRTADIEKILILGVHGPKRLVVFLTKSEH